MSSAGDLGSGATALAADDDAAATGTQAQPGTQTAQPPLARADGGAPRARHAQAAPMGAVAGLDQVWHRGT